MGDVGGVVTGLGLILHYFLFSNVGSVRWQPTHPSPSPVDARSITLPNAPDITLSPVLPLDDWEGFSIHIRRFVYRLSVLERKRAHRLGEGDGLGGGGEVRR